MNGNSSLPPRSGPARPVTICRNGDCEIGRNLRRQIEEAKAEARRVQEIVAAVADANARASLLMAELDEARESMEQKNRALIEHGHMLADALEHGQAADRAKSLFLANISHEIRTPLNGIIGMTELALETGLNAEQQDYLNTIRTCSDFLLQLINDVLDFSKLQAEKVALDRIPFNVRDVLEESVRALAVQAHGKGLELICDIEPEVPEVLLGDPGRLHQVVLNLVSNAVKFTANGEVLLRARRHEPGAGQDTEVLHISVRDTGTGIPKEKQQAVFEPFTQADDSICRTHGGTGLGLTVCARLVALMDGVIWLESEPGEGSEFHFTAQFGQAPDARLTPALPKILAGLRVLIVDHNEITRRVLQTALLRHGILAVSAADGSAAIALIQDPARRQTPFHIALIDLRLPGMNATGLHRHLRQLPECGDTRIVYLSSAALGTPCDLDAIPDAKLMKPVKQSDLLALMARLRAADAPRHPAKAPPGPARRLRILLAEDNRVNQVVASRMLEKWGHSVQIADDGEQAVEICQHADFDLILMDVHMPRLNGLEASRRIRERERHSGRLTPIIALTASSTEECGQACTAAGMDAFLLKPIRGGQLAEMIDSLETRASRD